MGCVQRIYEKRHDIKNRKRGYDIQAEGSYLGEILQRARVTDQNGNKMHGQVSITEAPKKAQEEYMKLHFITSLESEIIPLFEESLCRSNMVVQMYH